MKVLVTGAAGFIGFHLTQALLARGDEVVGLDNLGPSYDPKLKTDRLQILKKMPGFTFSELDITEAPSLSSFFEKNNFEKVFHLAAIGGVVGSTRHPENYLSTNVNGFLHVLEGCRKTAVRHLIYASSSSVYGANPTLPLAANHPVDHPLSIYAVTKRTNELMAHSFSHIYQLPTTGLRFFTVYGPFGRPDMAIFQFTKAILNGEPIEIFGDGSLRRDFTYIEDAVDGILKASELAPAKGPASNNLSPATSADPFRIYNVGYGESISVLDCVKILEKITGKAAKTIHSPERVEDMVETHCDASGLEAEFGCQPQVPLKEGLRKFVEWYRGYYS